MGDSSDNRHPTSCRGQVEAVSKTDDRDAQLLKLFERGDQVPKVPPDPVETPYNYDALEFERLRGVIELDATSSQAVETILR